MLTVDGPHGIIQASDLQAELDAGRITRAQVPKDGLSCPGCQAAAYFVRRSRDGRPAHFSARHQEDCDQSGHQVTASPAKTTVPKIVPVRRISVSELEILPPEPPRDPEHRRRAEASASSSGIAAQNLQLASPTHPPQRPTMRLSALLSNLRQRPDYAQQLHHEGKALKGISGTTETDPLELIQAFEELGGDWMPRLGQKVIVWGRFEDIRYHAKSDHYYVNQGPYGHSLGALRLGPGTAEALVAPYTPPRGIITQPSQLACGYVIAIGTVGSTSDGSSLSVAVDSGCAYVAPRKPIQYRGVRSKR